MSANPNIHIISLLLVSFIVTFFTVTAADPSEDDVRFRKMNDEIELSRIRQRQLDDSSKKQVEIRDNIRRFDKSLEIELMELKKSPPNEQALSKEVIQQNRIDTSSVERKKKYEKETQRRKKDFLISVFFKSITVSITAFILWALIHKQ
jgi:hypothetical protein